MKRLNENGFYSGAKLEIRTVKSVRKARWKYKRSATPRCVNYSRNNRCRAVAVAWERKSDKLWFIEYRNDHNHERLTCEDKSKRHKQLFVDLALLKTNGEGKRPYGTKKRRRRAKGLLEVDLQLTSYKDGSIVFLRRIQLTSRNFSRPDVSFLVGWWDTREGGVGDHCELPTQRRSENG